MEIKGLLLVCFIGCAAAQTYRVCTYNDADCQSLELGNSQATCTRVNTRVECAVKIANGEADLGYFSEEEVLLLGQQQPDLRVVAAVRNFNRAEPVAFEAVAVVPSSHTGGVAGLRGGSYCHPGLDETEQRWSPRVLKALEVSAAQTDRCGDVTPAGKSADQIEVETLNSFFSSACRPGPWSHNQTLDASLKDQYKSLCSLCNNGCTGYSIDMGVTVAGVDHTNRHIQALECLRVVNKTAPAVAYVAWSHVINYFTIRNPQDAAGYSVLCPDGSLRALSSSLSSTSAPCAFVRQPWGSIITAPAQADAVLASLRGWWPTGDAPAAAGWQTVLYSVLTPTGNNKIAYQDSPVPVSNVTNTFRPLASIDSSASCLPALRWCTLSPAEQNKCNWLRNSAYTLGVQPSISCQQRASVLDCFKEIRENRADFISSPSNYGYLARQHYKLSPAKLVQNQRSAISRVAAFVKESSNATITRFENLKGTKACFPEYGGLAYMAFVRAGQENGILSKSECDYARVVGELFTGACAPGAADASHALSESNYDATNLCSVCKPALPQVNGSTSICTWDYSNLYFGNNGSLACLADPETDVAFINTQNIASQLTALKLQANQFRALCRNNSLALQPGVQIDDSCALAYVVDAEIVTRRNDPIYNSLNVLLDTLDKLFGYSLSGTTQLINLSLFSSFNGVSDLLFKDSTIGLTEALESSSHDPAKNYMELFKHLDGCTSAAGAAASFVSMFSLIVLSLVGRFIIN